jgi:uncharacterized peroxidase-related enzyme
MFDSLMKPYIQLDNSHGGGILSLFMFDKGVAKHLSAMAQELMRRPSSLTVGERELIAAYASKLNECQFCYRSHKSCAEETGDRDQVNEFLESENRAALPLKLRALMVVVLHVGQFNREGHRERIPKAIADAKSLGATDQEIHDTVAITAFFNMCNRYVDGLGTTYNPGEEIQGGKSLAKYGYLMTIRRFVGEILPQMFSRQKTMTSALPR